MGQLIGYSSMCAELAGMKDMTQRESEESRLFGQKFMQQYKYLELIMAVQRLRNF